MPISIDIRKIKILPICMMFVLIVQVSMGFSDIEGMQMLSYLLLALVILSFLFLSYIEIKGRYVQKIVVLVALFMCVLLVISLLFGADVKSTVYLTMECLACVMMFDYYKENMSMLLKASSVAFAFCIFYNFYNMLQNPTWIVESDRELRGFLLGGNYNQMGGRMLCGVVTCMLCLKFTKKWLLLLIPEIIVCIVSLGLVGSMTSLTCMIGLVVVSMLPSLRTKRMAALSIMILFLLFQIFIVFNGSGFENNDTARYIVEDVMGKDVTFSRRTEKWYAAGQLFLESPIIGYGNVGSEWYLANLAPDAVGPHNFVFALLINGGLVLFALFGLILYYSYLPIARIKDHYSTAIVLGFIFFSVMQLMEVFPFFFNFYLLILMCFYPYICKNPIFPTVEYAE